MNVAPQRSVSMLRIATVLIVFATGASAFPPDAMEPGRWKLDGTSCYWDANDEGPDQCDPNATGRWKWDGVTCYYDGFDSAPNQCDPENPPQPPAITLNTPTAGARLVAPTSVVLSADASTSPGLISHVEFYVGSSQVAVVSASPYSYTWTPPSLGAYTVSARAVNSYGLASWSSPAAIRVVPSVRVAAGAAHAVLVTDAGTVWAWGGDSSGQLGQGTTTAYRAVPVQVPLANVIAVAAGYSSSYALTSDGAVWAWGSNANGRLGNGGTISSSIPIAVNGLSGVVAIAAGDSFAMALKSDGTVWAWGMNTYGQLGDSSTTDHDVPVAVSSLGSVIAIAATRVHSHALKADGSVWSWGLNNTYELGNGTSTTSTVPVQTSTLPPASKVRVGLRGGFAITADAMLWSWGSDGVNTPLPRPAQSTFTSVFDIAGGYAHDVAIKTDGSVWTWGSNSAGQLGDGTTTQHVAPAVVPGIQADFVATGSSDFVLAVSPDGTVWSWGANSSGQLGDGTTVGSTSPIQIADAGFAWRVATPSFSYAGGNYTTPLTVTVTCATPGATVHYTTTGLEPTESDLTLVSGATVSVTQNTTLKARAWKAGQPASNIASATYTLTPIQPSFSPAGGTYTSARSVTISTSTTGTELRYTTDGSTPSASSSLYTAPVQVATATTLKAIALKTGWSNSAVSSATYTFNYATLAAPAASPVTGLFEGQVAVALTAAAGATIRYTTNGSDPTSTSTIYTAPLVLSTTTTLKAKAFQIDYGASATMTEVYTVRAVTPVLSVPGGTYAAGELVTITSPDPAATLRITLNGADPTASDSAIASGTSLLIADVTIRVRAFKAGCTDSVVAAATYVLTEPLGTGALAAGANHTVLATPGGLLYAWGLNTSGQLGDGSNLNRTAPRLVQTLTGITALSAGSTHTVAATRDGRVFTWGANGSGQLGDGSTTASRAPIQVQSLSNIVGVAAGSTHSLALTSDGLVYAWGSGGSGQLGLGSTTFAPFPTLVPSLSQVVAVAAGSSHSLAVTSSGALYAWGYNYYGQLGDGTGIAKTTPTLVSAVSHVVSIAAGSQHSLAQLDNGATYVWGAGSSGQLGLGNYDYRLSPTLLPGVAANLLAGGDSHTLVRRSDGAFVAWGANTAGQIGDTTTTIRLVPTPVIGPPTPALVAAGGSHSVAVTPDGQVWTWGAGGSGQLGDGTTSASRATPQQIFTLAGVWGGAPDPTLSSSGGTFDAVQTVAVSSTIADGVIRYTTNGVDPGEGDPVIVSGGQIVVDRTLVLKARAWSPTLGVSRVVAASFTLKPAAPSIVPAGGTFTAAQTVTLTCATPESVVRYTLDGSEPSEASALYSGSFPVSTFSTLKARGFRDGWTPSDVTAATFTFNYGVLQAPIASPGSGTYSPEQPITLSAEPASVIRYTLDGSEPSSNSPVYTAPLLLPIGLVTLNARAFSPDWQPSDMGTWTYQITTDFTPPTISAQVSPPPNAAGWNSTDVTVTFTCTDSGLPAASCTPPVSVTEDGQAIEVHGEAVDAAGNRATLTVIVNVDRSAPRLAFYTPEEGDFLPPDTTSAIIRGNVLESVSGIASVTCGSVVGTTEGQSFACEVPVVSGANSIVVTATDIAGNERASTVNFSVSDPPAPTSLEITPAKMTMIAGEIREVRVVDNRGKVVLGGTWTVDQPLVAEVTVEDNKINVTAMGSGQATLTLTRNELSAQATVTVLLSGTVLPAGTAVWESGALPESSVKRGQVLRANRSDDGETPSADLFFVDEGTEWGNERLYRRNNRPTRIWATTFDGRRLWSKTIAPGPTGWIKDLAVDSNGGLLIVWHSSYDGPQPRPQHLQRLDGATGNVSWEYSSDDGPLSDVAVREDGTIFVVEKEYHTAFTNLISLDPQTGAPTRWRLPHGYFQAFATGPVVREDGSVVVLFDPHDDVNRRHLMLATVPATGGGPIFTDLYLPSGSYWLDYADYRVIPNGDGLVVAQVRGGANVFRIAADNSVSAIVPLLPRSSYVGSVIDVDYAVADTWGVAFIKVYTGDPAREHRVYGATFDPVTLTSSFSGPSTAPSDLYTSFRFIGTDGSAYYSGEESGNETPVAPGQWASLGQTAALTIGQEIQTHSASPYLRGGIVSTNAPPIQIYVHLQFTADWGTELQMDGLTGSELEALQTTARTTVDDAFKARAAGSGGYAVRAVVKPLEDAKVSKYNRRIYVDSLLGGGKNGETQFGSLSSYVHMGTLLRSFKSAFDCGEGQDCKQTTVSAMEQKTGFSRGELITALGRGIGATAAHEMGEQFNLSKGVRSFTFDNTTCQNCYEYTLPEGVTRYPRVYFLGPLQWSERGQKAMLRALPPLP